MNYMKEAIAAELLNLHTCYLGKVLSVSGDTATVQPRHKLKQIGKDAKAHAPVPGVPVAGHCKGRIVEKELTYVSGMAGGTAQYETVQYLTFEPLKAGDVVICVCGERDITDGKKGVLSTPSYRHHALSDSMIIGIL